MDTVTLAGLALNGALVVLVSVAVVLLARRKARW